MDVIMIHDIIPKLTCVAVSKTILKDHLIVLHEFFVGKKHTP